MEPNDIRLLLSLGAVIIGAVVPLNATVVAVRAIEEGNKKAVELLLIWFGYSCYVLGVAYSFFN